MLTSLAAVFVGGTSVFGGKGTIFGTFMFKDDKVVKYLEKEEDIAMLRRIFGEL